MVQANGVVALSRRTMHTSTGLDRSIVRGVGEGTYYENNNIPKLSPSSRWVCCCLRAKPTTRLSPSGIRSGSYRRMVNAIGNVSPFCKERTTTSTTALYIGILAPECLNVCFHSSVTLQRNRLNFNRYVAKTPKTELRSLLTRSRQKASGGFAQVKFMVTRL